MAGMVAIPRACGDAGMIAAYITLKCEALFERVCWSGSRLTPVQRCLTAKYPKVDFDFWVTYGSWSMCKSCGSLHFNDEYFREAVYEGRRTSSKPDLLCLSRRRSPADPCEYSEEQVEESSRWWYLPGMYQPDVVCSRCTPSGLGVSGASLLETLRAREAQYSGSSSSAPVRTQQLYAIPRGGHRSEGWALECVTWPKYDCGAFSLTARHGDSMLDLTQEEQQALQIIVLRTSVRQEKYGAAHHLNWKKVGLSRAYFRQGRLREDSMPTARAAAAFRFLQEHNEYYKAFLRQHNSHPFSSLSSSHPSHPPHTPPHTPPQTHT